MATFLKAHETRNLALSVTASVIAGIATILIAGTYMARKGSEQTIARTMAIQQQPRIQENIYNGNMLSYGKDIYNMGSVDMKGTSSDRSRLSVSIITNEFFGNKWNPVLEHTFYGETEEELENLIQSHRRTDIFFEASFEGVFNWKGTEIKLKNSEPKLLYA